jgi:hypothetical protein
MTSKKVKKGSEEERNQRRREGKSRREGRKEELEQVSQTCEVRNHGKYHPSTQSKLVRKRNGSQKSRKTSSSTMGE